MNARLITTALLCLVPAACTSQAPSTETRQRWCGTGGGAARGALIGAVVPAAAGAQGGPAVFVLGVALAPVGAVVGGVVGAVDGSSRNPCPDGRAASAEPPPRQKLAEPAEHAP